MHACASTVKYYIFRLEWHIEEEGYLYCLGRLTHTVLYAALVSVLVLLDLE